MAEDPYTTEIKHAYDALQQRPALRREPAGGDRGAAARAGGAGLAAQRKSVMLAEVN
jgi:hypothetical protein